eukprot:4867866-Prymnesium_polylepis.1
MDSAENGNRGRTTPCTCFHASRIHAALSRMQPLRENKPSCHVSILLPAIPNRRGTGPTPELRPRGWA